MDYSIIVPPEQTAEDLFNVFKLRSMCDYEEPAELTMYCVNCLIELLEGDTKQYFQQVKKELEKKYPYETT
jgi:hypothetical protein